MQYTYKFRLCFFLIAVSCLSMLSQCKKQDPDIRFCKVIDAFSKKGIPNAEWYMLGAGQYLFNPDNPHGLTNECGEFACDRLTYFRVGARKEGYFGEFSNTAGLYTESDPVIRLFAESEVLVRIHNDPNINEYEKVRVFGFYEANVMEHDNTMQEDTYFFDDHLAGNRYLELTVQYIQGSDTVIIDYPDTYWIEPFVFNEFVITY